MLDFAQPKWESAKPGVKLHFHLYRTYGFTLMKQPTYLVAIQFLPFHPNDKIDKEGKMKKEKIESNNLECQACVHMLQY